jgi:CubicO group peptidase (beta-lactamase class C family)
VTAAQVVRAYFPPPESAGGWRSLVPHNGTPSAAQKSEVRNKGRVDWDKLLQARRYSQGFTSDDAVLVIRNGYVVGDWGRRDAYGVASVSKSLTGLTMAKLFDLAAAGQVSRALRPDEEIYELLPSSWGAASAQRRQIKVEHVLGMASGIVPHDSPNAANYTNIILSQPMRHSPASTWSYASLPVDLLSIAIQHTTKKTLRDHFNQQIAAPIGVPAIEWNTFGAYTGASSKAKMRARDLARVGYLTMMNGRWGTSSSQKQIVSSRNIAELRFGCCSPTPTFQATAGSPFPLPSSSPRHYGLLWWTNKTQQALGSAVPADAYYAHGFRETLLVVVPSLNLIVVRYGPKPDALPAFRTEFMRRVMAAVIR